MAIIEAVFEGVAALVPGEVIGELPRVGIGDGVAAIGGKAGVVAAEIDFGQAVEGEGGSDALEAE